MLSAAVGAASASVDDVLACVVFVPSAPLLVPELAGPDAVDTFEVRSAVRDAGALLAGHSPHWLGVGVDDAFAPVSEGVATSGSFGRFGVDVPVSLGTEPAQSAGHMPLSLLIAGWLRAQVGAESVRPVVVDAEAPPDVCDALGRRLAADIDVDPHPIGVLVVGDGATALTAKAPGGGRRQSAVALQELVVDAIGSADVDAVRRLGVAECAAEGVSGRAAWQVAAGLVGHHPVHAELQYADAPFGVGYLVASWTPESAQ